MPALVKTAYWVCAGSFSEVEHCEECVTCGVNSSVNSGVNSCNKKYASDSRHFSLRILFSWSCGEALLLLPPLLLLHFLASCVLRSCH
jgi:hypothetical protein